MAFAKIVGTFVTIRGPTFEVCGRFGVDTVREFTLDPLYQHTVSQYEADPLFVKQQYEFVLDTSFGGSRRDRTAHT